MFDTPTNVESMGRTMPERTRSRAGVSSLIVRSAVCIVLVRKEGTLLEIMARFRARGLLSLLQLYCQQSNRTDSMKVLDMVRSEPHLTTRGHLPSSGVIGIGTCRYLGTVSADSDFSEGKRSDMTFASFYSQRSLQRKGDKKLYPSMARKDRTAVLNHKMASDMGSVGTTTEAIAVLKDRLQRGISTDSYTYIKVLQMCLKQKDPLAVKQVHDCIIESGMDNNLFVATTLLHVYIKCGRLLDGRRVFDELEKKSVVTWTMMISGYATSDQPESALNLLNRMCNEGVQPNAITYLSILKAFASPLALKWGKAVHARIQHAGLESDVRVGNALLQMYAKCGSITEARRFFDKMTIRDSITFTLMISAYAANGNIEDARLLFDRMEKRHIISWNIIIGAYAELGHGSEAYKLFLQMRREGFEPDVVTYVNILNASASAGALVWVRDVYSHASRAGLESDLRVGNALIHMYAKCGSIGDARLVFDRMEKRDVFTWTKMIGGLAQHGCGHEALELFRKMNAHSVKPDGTTFVAVFSACCHAGLLDEGQRLFSAMTEDYGIEPDIVHYNCMVDLLGRSGHLEEAKLFIDDMPVKPNAVTWATLLGACRTYSHGELGELAATELLKMEPQNASAYVLLSNIYAAAGRWEKVSWVRTLMQQRGVLKEPGRSWIEVDNKIHDFVAGDTAHPETKAIHSYVKQLTEKLKTEGYMPNTQLVLQDVDEEDKKLALCSHSEKLAIAYGLMHIPLGLPIRVQKNLRVCPDCHEATKVISKVTGREIIARDANRYHHFRDGVCSCGDYW